MSMVISIAILAFSSLVVHEAYEKQKIAEKISEASFQSSLIRSEYFQYPGERQKAQWISIWKSNEVIFEESSSLFDAPEEQELFRSIITFADAKKNLFEELVSNVERGDRGVIVQELNNQLSMIAQHQISATLRLSELSRDAAGKAVRTLTIVISMFGIFAISLAIVVFLMNKDITASIRQLAAGTKEIASGKLELRLSANRQDEIGDLARDFNAMTGSLAALYGSLEEKIEERTRDVAMFKLAVDSATEGIIITDAETRIVYANPVWLRMNGYQLSEVLHQPANILKTAKTDERILAELRAALRRSREFRSDAIVNRRKDGTEYDAELTIYPVQKDEKTLFFVGIHSDITGRKRSDRVKSEFISLASHQLRTPLSVIRLALDTLRNIVKGPLNDGQTAIVAAAQMHVVRMTETINTLLAVSLAESGKTSITPDELRFAEVIQDACRAYEGQLKRKHLRLHIECPPTAALTTDRRMITEIIATLVENAVLYTPEGGSVSVRCTEEKHGMRITIGDSGIGIPACDVDKVFTKFFRAPNAVKISTDGAGLGLYLVQAFVTLLHGSVSMRSQEGQGTEFTVHLPPFPPLSHDKGPHR